MESKVWNEDFGIKIRRQKMLDMNFKDFVGLPKNIEDRIFKNKTIEKFELPILDQRIHHVIYIHYQLKIK